MIRKRLFWFFSLLFLLLSLATAQAQTSVQFPEMEYVEVSEKTGVSIKLSRLTIDQIANVYVLAHTRADFLIIGPRSVEQLRRTVQALEVAKFLTAEDLDYLYYNN